jgi:hypothetical protein
MQPIMSGVLILLLCTTEISFIYSHDCNKFPNLSKPAPIPKTGKHSQNRQKFPKPAENSQNQLGIPKPVDKLWSAKSGQKWAQEAIGESRRIEEESRAHPPKNRASFEQCLSEV